MEQNSMKNGIGDRLKKYWPVLLLLAMLLVVGGVGGRLLAKYVTQNRQQAEMISAGFHISSDYLKEMTGNPQTFPAYSTGTSGDLVILLNNYEVENVAQKSEIDITYTVTVNGGTLIGVHPNGTGANLKTETDMVSFVLPKTADYHTLTITPNTGASMVRVSITTAPYNKPLGATFVRNVADDPAYKLTKVSDGTAGVAADDVYKLTIKTNGYTGTIDIVCNIAPDNTNNKMPASAWKTGDTGRLTVQANETYELLFFGSATPIDSYTPITGQKTITVGNAN